MFSGIVEEIGITEQLKQMENLSTLNVRARRVIKGLKPGASVSVNGACLTVAAVKKNVLSFDMMRETLDRTTLGMLRKNAKVNLERALKANARIDGHFVTGHVDTVGTVQKINEKTNFTELVITLGKEASRTIVPKGSVCIDGVSLTVGPVTKSAFSVYLIPFTKKATTLGQLKKGDRVNIETDILAKYILNRK